MAVPWTIGRLHALLKSGGQVLTKRTVERSIASLELLPPPLSIENLADEHRRPIKRHAARHLSLSTRRKRAVSLFVQLHRTPTGQTLIAANDGRNARRWVFLPSADPQEEVLIDGLRTIIKGIEGQTLLWPHGVLCARLRGLADTEARIAADLETALPVYQPVFAPRLEAGKQNAVRPVAVFSHLDRLEAESMHILREVVATADKPAMLYSVGKDSSVMLHLAQKAFYPATPPFPLLHIDTGWKFQEMYLFRDRAAADAGMKLIVHRNPEGVASNVNPIDHGSVVHTDVMKTQGLKQALQEGGFDVAFGGARRDEERSRAKERIFSFRSESQRWDPKNQRPEIWNLYNTAIGKGQSIRAFPISNWTELDVWQYIHRERIPVVPLYYAAVRPCVRRDGTLIMLDDDRLQPFDGETVLFTKMRFRTLGCYPLTGGFESDADDPASVILELLKARNSERQGRAIDTDGSASMEMKKQEGYF